MLLAERQIGADTAKAMASYRTAVEQNPKNYVALNNLAYLYLQAGQLDEAKKHGRAAVALQPDNAAALDTLAQVHVAEKDYEKAVELYNRAVTDAMQNEEIYLNYVEALFAAGQDFLANRKLKQRDLTSDKALAKIEELKAKYKVE
jgi:Flp pilus assembly protein TadD